MLGVCPRRRLSRSTFSIESNFTERTDLAPIDLAFRNGFYQGDVPANSQIIFRVSVPFGASKWQHTSIHNTDIDVRVDQGSLPPPVGSTSPPSLIPSSRTDSQVSGSTNITPTGWPLIHEKDYFVVASNLSDTAQPFSITLNGAVPAEVDDDEDGQGDGNDQPS